MKAIVESADWISWIRSLRAIGKTGLHFTRDHHDRERYEQIMELAAEMLANHTNLSKEQVLDVSEKEFGYQTPKIDARGVVFRDDKILLVREVEDGGRWTVPGGYADVNEPPALAVEREVFEESGFETKARKLLAVWDREVQGHQPPFPYSIYKMFFLCEIVGGEAKPNFEADAVEFFSEDELPELSDSRIKAEQIHRFFEHLRDPALPTEFD